MSELLRRPSTAFLLLAGAVAVANAAFGWLGLPEPWTNYLPVVAILTGAYGAAWLVFELVARGRARHWLGWLSFAIQFVSVALAFVSHFWTAGVVNSDPDPIRVPTRDAGIWWSVIGSAAFNLGGYVAVVSLAPILPAVMLATVRPRRSQQA